MTLLQHKVEGELTSELDKPVVSGFCDDEDGLDNGVYARATWRTCLDTGRGSKY